MTRKIMGVDCSSNTLAFSIFEDEDLVHWGEIKFGKGDIMHRANNANRVVNNLIDNDPMFQNIEHIFYESAVYIQNKKTVILLAYAFGAAIAPFAKPGVVVEGVVPTAWQNFIGNKAFTKAEKQGLKNDNPGKSESWLKEKMRSMRKQRNIDFVKKQFDVVAKNDNVADAICVGFFGVKGGKNA